MQGQNNNNNNTQEPGFIADEANNNTIAAGATQSTSSESSSEFDATLGTGIEGLLYVIVGGALCVVGVTVLIGVVVVSRRKKRRKHRSQTEFSIGIDVDNDAARNVGVAKVRAIADNGGETVGGYDIAPPLGSNDVNGNDVAIPTLRHTELPPSPRPQYDSSKFPIGQAPNDRPLPSFM